MTTIKTKSKSFMRIIIIVSFRWNHCGIKYFFVVVAFWILVSFHNNNFRSFSLLWHIKFCSSSSECVCEFWMLFCSAKLLLYISFLKVLLLLIGIIFLKLLSHARNAHNNNSHQVNWNERTKTILIWILSIRRISGVKSNWILIECSVRIHGFMDCAHINSIDQPHWQRKSKWVHSPLWPDSLCVVWETCRLFFFFFSLCKVQSNERNNNNWWTIHSQLNFDCTIHSGRKTNCQAKLKSNAEN